MAQGFQCYRRLREQQAAGSGDDVDARDAGWRSGEGLRVGHFAAEVEAADKTEDFADRSRSGCAAGRPGRTSRFRSSPSARARPRHWRERAEKYGAGQGSNSIFAGRVPGMPGPCHHRNGLNGCRRCVSGASRRSRSPVYRCVRPYRESARWSREALVGLAKALVGLPEAVVGFAEQLLNSRNRASIAETAHRFAETGHSVC